MFMPDTETIEAATEETPAVEIELEKVDYGTLAYYASDVYTTLAGIDDKLFSATEKVRLGKAKNQSLKLMCFGIDALYKEHFPEKSK